FILHRRQRYLVPERCAIAAVTLQRHRARLPFTHRAANTLDFIRVGIRAIHALRRRAKHFIGAVTGHYRKRRIDEHHRQGTFAHIHHHHGVVAGLQALLQNPLVLLRRHTLGHILDDREHTLDLTIDHDRHKHTLVDAPLAVRIDKTDLEILRLALDGVMKRGIKYSKVALVHGLGGQYVAVTGDAPVIVSKPDDRMRDRLYRPVHTVASERTHRIRRRRTPRAATLIQ